jgi:hypothetical protein
MAAVPHSTDVHALHAAAPAGGGTVITRSQVQHRPAGIGLTPHFHQGRRHRGAGVTDRFLLPFLETDVDVLPVGTLLEVIGRGSGETSEENIAGLQELYQEIEDRIEGVTSTAG